jgi:hypothetical protein
MLMGYFDNGCCPMHINDACSMYEHRPQTCRTYDCRIFAAAGIDAGGKDKALINSRVRLWKFSYPAQSDRTRHNAVKAAARFIQTRAQCFPNGRAPVNPGDIAVLAIKVYDIFMGDVNAPPTDIANAIVAAGRAFDAKSACSQ